VATWFDELPDLLRTLAASWGIDLGAPIPRGSVSVVIRCRLRDGRRGVLKVSPDRARLASEAAALERWATPHTPAMLALDERLGALLIEAIEPGTPLDDSAAYPSLESVAELLTSLHTEGVPDPSYPPLERRVAYLFDSSTKLYAAHPELAERVPLELYDRGRRLAMELAAEAAPTVLLHGDLTPSNILDGASGAGSLPSTRRRASATPRSTRSTSSSGRPTRSRRSRRAARSSPRRWARARSACSRGARRSPR
jgi:streptomycin 6-kinase